MTQMISDWCTDALNNIQGEHLKYFSKFIYLWMSFNNFYKDKYTSGGDKDKVLCSFSQDPKYIEKFKVLVAEPRNDFKVFQNYILTIKPVNTGYILDMKNEKKRVTFDTICNLSQYMQCIYQIRNNLFHGDKSPENGQDSKLVELAYISFHKLLTALDTLS